MKPTTFIAPKTAGANAFCKAHAAILLLAAAFFGACTSVKQQATPTCYFKIDTTGSTGISSDSIFICVVGNNIYTDNTGKTDTVYSYLNFNTGELNSFSKYSSGVTSVPLSSLANSGDSFAVPAIMSARMYMAIGKDFNETNFVKGSGPSLSKVNDGGADVLFDFVEFDTHVPQNYNVNSTNVDMYAFSYTMSLLNTSNSLVTRGISPNRHAMLNQFRNIPPSRQAAWYQQLFVLSGDSSVLRYLAPQQAAYNDFDNNAYRKQLDSYYKHYVLDSVFKPNRTFTFYDKLWPNPQNLDTGFVNSNGSAMLIKKTNGDTFSIIPPVSPAGFPSQPPYWHNQAGADTTIDWSFMLFGNSLTASLPGNWGHNAPDPALMALMISICRGVAHLDSAKAWTNPSNYYGKSGGITEYYSNLIHQNANGGFAYAWAYDDIYGQNSSVGFNPGTTITINLTSCGRVAYKHLALSE